MRRLFIPPDWIEIDRVSFPSDFAQHLATLGLRPGDHLIVLDNSGWEHEVVLTRNGDEATVGQVVKKTLAEGERRTKISLYQGLVTPYEFEVILRRGTELGVVEFVPVACDRCEVPGLNAYDDQMLEDWREIIASTAEEAERGRLPRLEPALLFDAALERATRRGTALIIAEGEGGRGIRSIMEDNPFSVHILAPPSTGFTSREVDRASRRGVIPVRPPFDPAGDTPAGLLTSQALFEQLG